MKGPRYQFAVSKEKGNLNNTVATRETYTDAIGTAVTIFSLEHLQNNSQRTLFIQLIDNETESFIEVAAVHNFDPLTKPTYISVEILPPIELIDIILSVNDSSYNVPQTVIEHIVACPTCKIRNECIIFLMNLNDYMLNKALFTQATRMGNA